MKKYIAGFLCFVCSLAIISCTKNEAVQIAGSTTVLPVISKAAEYFKMEHPDINIIVNAGGSGVGINQLGGRKIDIAMSSRDITKLENKKYSDANFISHSIAKDAVVPAVSSEIYDSGMQALTIEQIAKIYKGEITNWQEVGGPNQKILVIDKERSRGTRHIFMQVILDNKEADAPGADLVLGSNNEEQTAIAQSDAAIGMLSHAWLNNDVKGLAIIMSDSTVVQPTLANIINGAFPITRSLLLFTNGTPEEKTKMFIDFILSSKGQDIVEESGYVGLR